MRQLTMLIALCYLICVGQVQAQTSLGDANATSSLIFPQAFLKEQVDRQKETDSQDVSDTKTLKSPDTETSKPSDTETSKPSDTETSKPSEPSGNRGTINFNTADGSIKGNYFFYEEGRPWRYGFELQGKAINGYASLFASQDISSDAGGHLFVIYSRSVNHWLLARAGYRHGEYKLVTLESDATVPGGLKDETLQGPSAFFHWNALLSEKFLLGTAIGWAHQSNYGELPQVEVTTVNPAPSDSTMTITESTSKARKGDYETFGTVSGHADLIYIQERSKHTVGIGAFGRYTRRFSETHRHQGELGAGLFYLGDLTEKNRSAESRTQRKLLFKNYGWNHRSV